MAYDRCSANSIECSLAIFPHSNAQQLLITYKSILEDLSLTLGTKVKLVSSRDLTEFAEKLRQKKFDIALIDPGQYISYAFNAGYVPIVRPDGVLSTRLYVHENSSIKSYRDLVGRHVGYMIEGTTTWFSAGALLKKYAINKKDLSLFPQSSQQACAHAMAIRQVEACFFVKNNLEVIQQQNPSARFRAIGDAFDVVSPVYAVHPEMPLDIKQNVKRYFLSRDQIIEAKNSDFDELRKQILKIDC